MSTSLDADSIANLKQMIGKKIKTITGEDWKTYGRSYGNVLVEIEEKFYTINNDYRIIDLEGDMVEVSGFSVKGLDTKNDYEPSVADSELLTEPVDKIIRHITIIRDTLTFTYGDHVDELIFDRGILIDLEDFQWLMSEEFIFEPFTYMYFGVDVTMDLPSLEELREVFAYDSESEAPAYHTEVARECILLSR